MAGISPEVVEQVRQASDIVEVIGQYVALKRSGAKFKALSPFNKEKTPSFYVDPTRQLFKCFSSGHGGDVFEFLKKHENMTFPEAVRRLAQRAGITLAEESRQEAAQRSQREDLLALHAGLARHWQNLLWSDPAAEDARSYLLGREFPQALAEEFGLGFAPPGWDSTSIWAQQNGYKREVLEAAKLVATNDQGRRYDFFRERLMIPIYDESGQVIAFSGRLLDPAAKAQKYLNSHETPIFQKSRVLFGLHKTKRPIITAGSAIICEGQIDLMRCWQAGIQNVVAPQGTAFTEIQTRALKRWAPEVVICFDADRAGQEATRKAIDLLVREGLQVRVARMPSGEDPDSLLRRQPPAVFVQILAEAKDHTRYLLDLACETAGDLTSPRAKGEVAAELAPVISAIPNEVQRESFLLEVARRLQVPRDLIEKEMHRYQSQQKQRSSTPIELSSEETAVAPAPDEQPWEVDRLIEELVSLLLVHPDQVAPVVQRLRPEWVTSLAGAEILQNLLAAHAADDWDSPVDYSTRVDDRTRRYLTRLLVTPVPLPESLLLSDYRDSLLRQAEHRWKLQQMHLLKQEVDSGLLNAGEFSAKLQELLDLKRSL